MPGLQLCSMVPLVLGLFFTAYISCIYLLFWKWMGFQSSTALLNAIFIHLWVGLTTHNYLKAVTTDPGTAPKDWIPDDIEELNAPPESNHPFEIQHRKQKKEARYCKRCCAYKPPRAHHCTECDKCTLKYDHHCPWINNCVGHYNHKYFLLFLLYIIIGATHMLVLYVLKVVDIVKHANPKVAGGIVAPLDAVLIAIQMVILFPTVLCVICLFYYQMELVMENMTSMESFDRAFAERRAKKRGKPYKFPYDRGVWMNLKEVFGNNVWLWFIPSVPEGDGLSYKMVQIKEDV